MAKTIMISNEVYNKLKNLKTEDKSYSELLRDLLNKDKTKKGSDLFSCFGILKKDKEWDDTKKDIKRGYSPYNNSK